MDKIKAIVRMNEAPTRPLHLHRIVRPVLSEDGELDFVGVGDADEDMDLTAEEAKVLAEFKPRLALDHTQGMIAPYSKDVRNIRGTPASAILNLPIRSDVRDQIELALIHMIAEYRRTWWADEDRKDAARRLEAQQEQENEDTQSRQRKREAQAEWSFLYGDESEGYEI